MATRLFTYLCFLPHVSTSSTSGGGDSPSHPTDAPDQPGQPAPEIEFGLPTNTGALGDLVELVPQFQSLLPDTCKWLEEGAIEITCDRPADAGEVADILVGMMGHQMVAIKRYRFHSSSDYLPAYMRFYEEALACSQFRNGSFVPFIGIYSTPKYPMCLVFEYMGHRNLKEYLRENRHVKRCELLLEIARAVKHLHHRGVVHKNLKATNVLIDLRGHAHLGGLGAAFIPPTVPRMDIDRFFHGAAPELASYRPFGSTDTGATKATDVYAFGVLAWEVFTTQFPFSNEGKIATVVSMWKGRRPARPTHPELSDRLWKTIERCWKAKPTQRITIEQIVAALEVEVIAIS